LSRVLVLVACCLFSIARASEQSQILDQTDQLERSGHFREAAAVLAHTLAAPSQALGERKQLEFELDRLERIRKDFPYTREQLYAELKKSVKDLTSDEYERWIHEGRFDTREIDGQLRFMGSSISNLFFRYPELYARRIPAKNSA